MPLEISSALELTEDEAYALLGLCLTSPNRLDAESERALRKLAEYCLGRSNHHDHQTRITVLPQAIDLSGALDRAGA